MIKAGPIRNHATFRHPEALEAHPDELDTLTIAGVDWFVDVLREIPRLAVDRELCQEDWGVVVFGRRDGFTFWFGLSYWDEEEFVAHVHHRGLLQRFRAAGRVAYATTIADLHVALSQHHSITHVAWHYESELDRSTSRGAASPDAT
jgi:hypothetical protein